MSGSTRMLGRLLAGLGVIVGLALGLALLVPVKLAGISWLIAVGLAKLTLAASLGLIGAGAVVRRIAARADQRAQLAAPRPPDRS
jgi:hypothetical protein